MQEGSTAQADYRAGDAKAYFASERTFLHWLSVAVTLGGLAAGLLGISGEAHKKWGVAYETSAIATRLVGLLIMAVSICIAIMASWDFYSRRERLKKLSDGPYDSRYLPLMASSVMLVVLLAVWITSIVKFARG